MKKIFAATAVLLSIVMQSFATDMSREIDAAAAKVLPQVIEWRRYLHQHPELSNREVNTSKMVADELRKLGIEVRTGIARTGVVGILKGGQPGPVYRPSRRHGRFACDRADKCTVQIDGHERIQRTAGRRDACMRARLARCDAARNSDGPLRNEGQDQRHCRLYLSAR